MSGKKNFYKNFSWNMLGTTTNAFTSLIYMIFTTRINGLEEAGVFSFAFSNACVLYCIGIYMGRTYQISDKKNSERSYLRVRWLTCLAMFVLTVIIAAVSDTSFRVSVIAILWGGYKMLDAYADFLYGVLQKNDFLYKVGISLTAKSILCVVVFVIIDFVTESLLIASVMTMVMNMFVILLYDYPQYRKVKSDKKSSANEIVFLFRDGFFVAGTTLLTNFLINASKYAISSKGSTVEQAIFGIIIMPASFMILAGQYLIHPYLLRITVFVQGKKREELSKLVKKISFVILLIGVFAMAAAFIFGIPFLELVYGVALSEYQIHLCAIILGATCYGIVVVLINVLTVMRKTKIQFWVFGFFSLLAFFLSREFVKADGINGACSIYVLLMLALILIFSLLLKYEIKKRSTHNQCLKQRGL